MAGSIDSKSKPDDTTFVTHQTSGAHDFREGEVVPVVSNASVPAFTSEELAIAYQQYVPGSKAEKYLVWKIDLFLLPMLWLMCVLAYVDRNNIGNADAAGLSEDLRLTDDGYSLIIAIFFVGYILFEVPSNILLSRLKPSWYLPGIMIVWGALVCGMSQAKDYKDVLVFRFFLGVIESGFFPGVLFIMTCWYKKTEIGKRFCFFFTALCFAGAASGLISGAVISGLEGKHGMRGWRWLFLVEGFVTIGIAIISIFVLVDYPYNASHRLSHEERKLATVRIMHDEKDSVVEKKECLSPLESVKAAACDIRVYVFVVLYMTQNGSTTVSYFIPKVLQNMGYAGVKAQWMTVPIWAIATLFLFVFSYTADRFNERRWHIVFGLSIAFIGGVVSVSVPDNNQVRYAMMCLYIAGLYLTLPLILTWCSQVFSLPAEKRAVVVAMVNCLGSVSSIYGSYLWPSTDAPHYTMGFTCVSCFIGFGIILAATLPILFQYLPKYQTAAERRLLVQRQEIQYRTM